MEWIFLLAAILLGVPAAAWLAQERLIFFPQPVVSTTYLPAEVKPLEIVATDGTRLRGWIRGTREMPAPVVLYFGGNAEEVSGTLVDQRWPRDWTIVAINYRGYGTSEGKPGEAALVADALVIYDAIVARPEIDARRIVALGRSLGTGVAVKLAAARPLAGCNPRLAVRQPGRGGPHPLFMAARVDAASAPFRFRCRGAADARAIACDRRGARFNHPTRTVAGTLRCVDGSEVLARRSRFRSQHPERAGWVLGRRRRIPWRSDLTPAN
jgi:pimeloyl-ACP methyl ester carboxylesterase